MVDSVRRKLLKPGGAAAAMAAARHCSRSRAVSRRPACQDDRTSLRLKTISRIYPAGFSSSEDSGRSNDSNGVRKITALAASNAAQSTRSLDGEEKTACKAANCSWVNLTIGTMSSISLANTPKRFLDPVPATLMRLRPEGPRRGLK